MKFVDDQIVTNGDMSLASIESEAVLLDQIIGYAVQCVCTGSPVGTLKLQVSCDLTDDKTRIVNWDDLDSSSTAISAAGITTYNVDMQYYKWFRLVYTRTSGSGVLNAVYNAKG